VASSGYRSHPPAVLSAIRTPGWRRVGPRSAPRPSAGRVDARGDPVLRRLPALAISSSVRQTVGTRRPARTSAGRSSPEIADYLAPRRSRRDRSVSTRPWSCSSSRAVRQRPDRPAVSPDLVRRAACLLILVFSCSSGVRHPSLPHLLILLSIIIFRVSQPNLFTSVSAPHSGSDIVIQFITLSLSL